MNNEILFRDVETKVKKSLDLFEIDDSFKSKDEARIKVTEETIKNAIKEVVVDFNKNHSAEDVKKFIDYLLTFKLENATNFAKAIKGKEGMVYVHNYIDKEICIGFVENANKESRVERKKEKSILNKFKKIFVSKSKNKEQDKNDTETL